YPSAHIRSYSSREPSNRPPSRAVRQVMIAGLASSSARAGARIASSARSTRYSIAVAPGGTSATSRLASARLRGASEATSAGSSRTCPFKTKTPEPSRVGGFQLVVWSAPPGRQGELRPTCSPRDASDAPRDETPFPWSAKRYAPPPPLSRRGSGWKTLRRDAHVTESAAPPRPAAAAVGP